MERKFKILDDATWALLAASREPARPVLTGLNVTEEEIVATDGHLLHLVHRLKEDAMVPGLWSRTPGQKIQGTFPKYQSVIQKIGTLRSLDAYGATAVLEAAIAYRKERRSLTDTVTLVCDNGLHVAFNPTLLKTALAGRSSRDQRVLFQAPKPDSPATFFVLGWARVALVMPVRRPDSVTGPHPRFDLGEYVHE